jgi:hypothetical protein
MTAHAKSGKSEVMDRRLYDDDFYLWSQDQAAALRAAAARAGDRANAIDWELLAGEVEDLGGSQLRECYSRVRTIIEHLAKLASSNREEPRSGWRRTVRVQRADLADALTPSIRRLVEARLEVLHAQAFEAARDAIEAEEPGLAVPSDRRWTLAQILGEIDDPLG